MLLSELAGELRACLIESTGDAEIGAISMNSCEKTQSGLFFCNKGAHFDAHDYAPQAIENGAVALVTARRLPLEIPQLIVRDTREAMGLIACAFYGHPSKDMLVYGVTGTNGKTTTTYLVKKILESMGHKVGLIGTTGNMIADAYIKSDLTTPEPIDLQRTLARMRDEGVTAVCIEVSAHAMALKRLVGMHFKMGCYTNLTQDHLDFFGMMEKYFDSKKAFFRAEWLDSAALNADDEYTERILSEIDVPLTTYGISSNADIMARDIEISDSGVSFRMILPSGESHPVRMRLTGMFNVYNALAAAAMTLPLGIAPDAVAEALGSVRAVPGRAEVLDTHTPYKVFLDYSHTPDAMENILKSVRTFAKGRVIAIFGCGGDRDHGKRPIMGEIGGKLADFSILTSDNPRSEDPYAILAAVEEGIKQTDGQYTVIENRRAAIRHALTIAGKDDIVVLVGKGHETYQEIKGVKYPFDEKVVVAELLDEINR